MNIYANSAAGVRAWVLGFKSATRNTAITVFDGETQENIEAELVEKPTSIIINQTTSEPLVSYENSQQSGTLDTVEIYYKTPNKQDKPDSKSGKKSGAKSYIPELQTYLLTPYKFKKWSVGTIDVTAKYISTTPLEYDVKQIIIEVS